MFRCLTASKIHQLTIFGGGIIEFDRVCRPVQTSRSDWETPRHWENARRTEPSQFPSRLGKSRRRYVPDHLGTAAISGNERAKHGIVRDRRMRPSPADTRVVDAVIRRTDSSVTAAMVPHFDLMARPEPHPTLKPALDTY